MSAAGFDDFKSSSSLSHHPNNFDHSTNARKWRGARLESTYKQSPSFFLSPTTQTPSQINSLADPAVSNLPNPLSYPIKSTVVFPDRSGLSSGIASLTFGPTIVPTAAPTPSLVLAHIVSPTATTTAPTLPSSSVTMTTAIALNAPPPYYPSIPLSHQLVPANSEYVQAASLETDSNVGQHNDPFLSAEVRRFLQKHPLPMVNVKEPATTKPCSMVSSLRC